MQDVLILTYYYLPSKGVAAYRPLSWAKDFPGQGFAPTVVTRHWSGNEKVWEDYLKECGNEIKMISDEYTRTVYLPYYTNPFVKIAEQKWIRKTGLNKLVYFTLSLCGNFQPEIDAYRCFKDFLFDHLRKHKYKVVIVNSPPLNNIKLAYRIRKKFNIPFVVDFQDSWNNMMLAEDYSPGAKEKFNNLLKKIYLKKWLKQALLVTTVTPAIGCLIEKITSAPVKIITNGFEQNAYSDKNGTSSAGVFNISVMGTIHPIQDINEMLKGLNLFLRDKNPEKIRLTFVGLDSIPVVARHVLSSLPAEFVKSLPRVSMDEAVKLTLSAHVLLFPSYKGYRDYYTAKIFEYLGARRNILMIPGNNDAVDELIRKTKAGKITASAEEFSHVLEEWYGEWKSTGMLKYHGIDENINFFSRENQNKLLCGEIKQVLSKAKLL